MSFIFKNYTGSAFLNNALQTIEALADIDDVSQITTDVLFQLYEEHEIWVLFKRMKSYSMLFSRNGPLLNDKDFGDKIFRGIIEHTLTHCEKEGQYQCEISGLRFNTSFSLIYEKVLCDIKYPVKKIKSKDKTINRCWFPLTGALGSDAQALPQATFEIKIHPICLVIIQFLPFAALLYKGGILLIDSANFKFSKDYIEDNVKRVLQEIETTPSTSSIENIKDFTQGDYILKAIKIYSEKQNYYDHYADLNLWSFTNSGTGARCFIDRIPNLFFKTLYNFYVPSNTRNDLVGILTSSITSSFLDCLFEKKDFWGLYPRKAKNKLIAGLGVPFYDAYQTAIGNDQLLHYAKYIACLIQKDDKKSISESKLLEKSDAYKEQEYNSLFYSVLLRATQAGEWTLGNHLEILDKSDSDLIHARTYGVFKMTHYYFQKETFSDKCPIPKETNLLPVISIIVDLIENDVERERSISRLQNSQEYGTFNINRIFIRNSDKVNLDSIVKLTYQDYSPRRGGLNKLLRIYFTQPKRSHDFDASFYSYFKSSPSQEFQIYQEFVADFQTYYLEKYNLDYSKYKKHILSAFPKTTNQFKIWILDVVRNMRIYYNGKRYDNSKFERYEENLFYMPNGEYSLSSPKFIIEFLLNQQFLKSFSNKENNNLWLR